MKKYLTTVIFIFILIGIYITAYLCGVFNEKSTIKAVLYGALFLPVLVFEWVTFFTNWHQKDPVSRDMSFLVRVCTTVVMLLYCGSFLPL